MTDAERIALYLGEKPDHIAEILAAPSRFAWDRAQISATQLASMLAAVRKEERQRCADIVVAASLQVNSPRAQHVLGEVAHKIDSGSP